MLDKIDKFVRDYLLLPATFVYAALQIWRLFIVGS